ncbi:hypothetical protein BDSB_20120 [Burkholderia dolosa PC543]|nr:hypothetical protein BDSB_20120 [Burkholderia dolosa PC543]
MAGGAFVGRDAAHHTAATVARDANATVSGRPSP